MKFKVGDRIRVYGTDNNFNPISVDTTVEGFANNGLLYVGDNAGRIGHFDLTLPHPKQCRKLVKKGKKK